MGRITGGIRLVGLAAPPPVEDLVLADGAVVGGDAEAFADRSPGAAVDGHRHGEGDRHGQERTEAGDAHVLLGVPDVALGAEEGEAGFGVDLHRGQPLEDFVDRREGEGELDGEVVVPEALRPRDADEHLAHRVGDQEAEAEVHQPVVHVAVGADPVLEGEPEGDLRVGVVRADDVEDHEQGQQGVGDEREPEPAAEEEDQRHAGEHEVVLEQPVLGVDRSDGGPHPDRGEGQEQPQQVESSAHGTPRLPGCLVV